MTGIVSLPLVSLCTPIPCSLALGQRLSLTFLSLAYLIPIPSCYCLGTYLALLLGDGYCLYLSYCLISLLSSWSLLSSGMLICLCYCLVLSEARFQFVYCSWL